MRQLKELLDRQVRKSTHSKGFHVFVKSVSSEILRRNPKAADNKSEIQRIIEKEWDSLTEDQRCIYERLASES